MSMRSPISVRRPWLVLALTIAAAIGAAIYGGGVADSLVSGGFDDPDSESSRAAAFLASSFDASPPDLVLVVDADGRSVDDPAVAQAGVGVADQLAARPDVDTALSYWTMGSPPPLKSTDGDKAMILVRLIGDDNAKVDAADAIRDGYNATVDGLNVGVGGMYAVYSEINESVESDLLSAELLAFPITALLLLIIFGTVTSALLPLIVGGFSIVGTLAVLQVITEFTEVSVFALNFTTAMGLGLAIDYALLVVNRFREELATRDEVRTAVVATVRTAGRTVLFSGLTVAASLAALLVFPVSFLRSFAWAGFAVVGLAVAGATVVLPAILALLGHRVNSLAIRRSVARPTADTSNGAWHRIATTVMKRPILVGTAATLILLALATPFLRLELGLPDDRVLPEGSETRAVSDVLRNDFQSREQSALSVVVGRVDATGSGADTIGEYAARLSDLDGVARVDSAVGSYIGGIKLPIGSPLAPTMATPGETYLSVVPTVEPMSAEAKQLVADVRATGAPGPTLVGGESAELVDSTAALTDSLPLALALIAIITFVVLFLFFGSILIPIKAVILNMLSLTGMMGAMVWVFQDGRFEDLLGFTATGTLTATIPVLMFVIAFGLSMDYEVFLLSRIREEWLATHDPIASVANGLERTGRIVTAAAVLIAVVFLSFGLTASVQFMIMFGFGMTLAILVDAFIIRTTLVPALMRLAGSANWWAPAPLRRLHDRFGLVEHDAALVTDDHDPEPVTEKV